MALKQKRVHFQKREGRRLRKINKTKKTTAVPPQTTGKPSQECHQHGLESEEAAVSVFVGTENGSILMRTGHYPTKATGWISLYTILKLAIMNDSISYTKRYIMGP